MKRALSALFIFFAVSVFPAFAQDSATHSITFDGFTFSYESSVASNVNVTIFEGDPPDLQQPGGPEVAHTQFTLYRQLPAPESMLDAAAGIRIYDTADFAGYESPAMRLQQLQTLLAQRPDLAPYMEMVGGRAEDILPFMPVFPAGQIIRARAQYVDTGSVSGISYVTVYRQDASPFVSSEFLYTFQGISSDGSHYVSAIFRFETTVFPAQIPADFNYEEFIADIDPYMAESVDLLNAASDSDFAPALSAFDQIVLSFDFTTAA